MKSNILLPRRWKISYFDDSIIWELIPQTRFLFPSGETAFCGILNEYFPDGRVEHTEYEYYPCDRLLCIDRSLYGADRLLDACIEERYRVERIGSGKYRLCDLEKSDEKPETSRLRIEVEKL